MKKVTVAGSGSWGTALAVMLDKNGHEVTLWARRPQEAEKIKSLHENTEYLPGVKINESINIEADRQKAVENADIVVMAIPSKYVRENMELFAPFMKPEQVIVNVAKGLERGTLLRLSQVIRQCIPQCAVCTLVGPSHAEEVGRGIPTACVVSGDNMSTAKMIQSEFISHTFRIYTNSDEIGMEIGAALKNVIALAAGANDGLGYGDNTKAALMTRGLAEIARLGVKMGGNPLTFNGLSGMGDLIVTCTSMHSRNRRAGILLGQGKSLSEALQEVHMVVEGVNTAKAAYDLSKKYNVAMPITETINKVLFEGSSVHDAVLELMSRDGKEEIYY